MDFFGIFFGLELNFNKYGDFIINQHLKETTEFYRFGAFRLDARDRRLWREDTPVQLTPKQFDLLFYFVENSGRVAKKSELLDAVWADTYIEETTLARNVSWLRKKLAECADGEPFIETVPKFGYRFTAEVTHSADEENTIIIEEQTVRRIRGEETIEFDDSFALNSEEREKERKRERELSKIPPSPFLPFSLSPLLLAAVTLIAVIGGGFIVYQSYSKNQTSKAVVVSRVIPFSGAAGYENSPAFSPDGRQLAYSWNGGEGANADIYVKLVGAGAPLQLTKTEANEHYPTFSPDGNHIAFIRGKYGEAGDLIIIPALGGLERPVARLFSGNYSISFSPDGQDIAVIDTEDSKEGGQHAVYLINIETGERRRVTAPAEFLSETTPRFSPDGASLAFIRVFKEDGHARNLARQDLFVVPVSGGKPWQMTFDGLIINSLAWSADGDYIYFVPVRPPNQTVIRRVPSSGGEQEIVSIGSKNITNIAFAPDGNTLVFAEDIRQWKLWRVPPDGQTGGKLLDSGFAEYFPTFSPDGARIAFQTDRTGEYQIWTMNTDGGNLRQITDTPFPSSSPQFSPDGSRIVFNQKEGENFYNYIISAEGGVPRRISPEGVQEDFPIWSADGEYIYFSSNRGASERNIWKTRADGTGEAVQITTIGAYRATPTLDGKTVYFTKTGFPGELWRVPAEGGSAEELVPEFEAAGFFNTWLMSEAGIYFIVPVAEKSFDLKFYDFAGGQVKDAPGKYKIPPHLDGTIFATDGNILLCSVMERSSQLMLADLP